MNIYRFVYAFMATPKKNLVAHIDTHTSSHTQTHTHTQCTDAHAIQKWQMLFYEILFEKAKHIPSPLFVIYNVSFR